MITLEQLRRMTVEITLGIPKEKSLVVNDEATSERWDRLAAEIAQMRQDGYINETTL